MIDILFPIQCQQCGKDGNWVCEECWNNLKVHSDQYCMGCKTVNFFGEYCENCKGKFYLSGISIASDYENLLLTKLIKLFKYNFVKDLDSKLGRVLVIFFQYLKNKCKIYLNDHDRICRVSRQHLRLLKSIFTPANDDMPLIVPVPLSKKRLRWRGYNQAEVLARSISEYFDVRLDVNSLKRIKFRAPQAKLTEMKRLANTNNNFICDGNMLKGKNIILVDDVVTTGATLNECARILKEGGAKAVWGLVIIKG